MIKNHTNELEQYFIQENIDYKLIPASKKNKTKTPDYEITSKRKKVIIEFKEFILTDEDKQLRDRIRRNKVLTLSEPPGINRIRNKLRECSKQFKNYSQFPCLCVLRNTGGAFIDLSNQIITMAMLGDISFGISVDIEGKLPPIEQGFQYGDNSPSQILRKEGGSLISAVAVLDKENLKWRLRIFHNYCNHTRIPLPKSIFTGQYDEEWIYKQEIGWKKS